ncbi:phosphatase PAP2 family protein [Salinisphaera sp. Q1T1-3]|uniref:phosphatase PAP2 family protein n=1 Tax=Salinisphaera sp. Q1T1-3 TaxID=2321229 RepID=UPI000E718EB1|nr:phosphatase PAP2 family protein [Salinisphaera sp. Q1T1-3]RJS93306.1 phosphatase PAP2 family protein [Salinisphaera sp. Q1T1-3]
MPDPLSFWLIILVIAGILLVARLIAGLLRTMILRGLPPLIARLQGWMRRVYGVPHVIELLRLRAPGPTQWVSQRFATDRFTGLPLTLFVLLAAYLVSLGSDLAEHVIEHEEIMHLDEHINRALSVVRDPHILAVVGKITHLADVVTLVAVTVVASAFLWADRRMHFLPGLWLAVIGSQTITYIGKYAIDRARPEFLTFASAATPSFPSGHATGAMAVYGFIAYAILREIDRPAVRFELAFWAGALIATIAASRLVLSVHFASDVAAGLIVGGFWLLAAFALTEYWREIVHRRHA